MFAYYFILWLYFMFPLFLDTWGGLIFFRVINHARLISLCIHFTRLIVFLAYIFTSGVLIKRSENTKSF